MSETKIETKVEEHKPPEPPQTPAMPPTDDAEEGAPPEPQSGPEWGVQTSDKGVVTATFDPKGGK